MVPGQPVHPAASEPRAGLGLRVEGAQKAFPDPSGGLPRSVLEGIDLDVTPHEFLAILGPSGCGKSTLLRLIAGLEQPSSGAVSLLGQGAKGDSGPGSAGQVGFVFQEPHLLPWRDVLSNTTLPLELLGVPPAERRAAAESALAAVGLLDFRAHRPAQLSGGMKMRVSLARTLVTKPRLLLLDEPFAALDELTRQSLDEALRRLWADSGMTVVFVTHSIAEAAFLAERAVVFSKGPGRIVAHIAVDLPLERSAELRSDPRFGAVVSQLQEALRRGSAGA